MKKYIVASIVLILVVFFGILIFQKNKPFYKGYKTTDLRNTLKEEGIVLVNKSYKENDKQVTIYLFRGEGCPHCQEFLEYLNSISEEYGKYFKLVSFEVWNSKENSMLQKKVASFLSLNSSTGVPLIVIGEDSYVGYSSAYDESIKKSIKSLYDQKESQRYDVFEKMDSRENGGVKAFKKSTVWNFTFMLLFAGVVIVSNNIVVNKNSKKILENQEEILKLLKKGKK